MSQERFPYGEAALLATLLWRRVTRQEVKVWNFEWKQHLFSVKTKVLVTLVHAIGRENLAETWIKDLKKESEDTVVTMEDLWMMSKVDVEKVVETSGVLVITAPQNSLGCVLHSQLARFPVYFLTLGFLQWTIIATFNFNGFHIMIIMIILPSLLSQCRVYAARCSLLLDDDILVINLLLFFFPFFYQLSSFLLKGDKWCRCVSTSTPSSPTTEQELDQHWHHDEMWTWQ